MIGPDNEIDAGTPPSAQQRRRRSRPRPAVIGIGFVFVVGLVIGGAGALGFATPGGARRPVAR